MTPASSLCCQTGFRHSCTIPNCCYRQCGLYQASGALMNCRRSLPVSSLEHPRDAGDCEQSALAMSDPFLKMIAQVNPHISEVTPATATVILCPNVSAWPALSCLHPPVACAGSRSLIFVFCGSSYREDCTFSSCSTTTRPVGCAFSSLFSSNASQFPGFTVRHTTVPPHPRILYNSDF